MINRFACAFVIVGLFALRAEGQVVPPTRSVDYPLDGAVLGNGWFSAAGAKTPGRCVEFEARSDPAQDQFMRFTQVRDKDSLMQALDVSAEFQAKTAFGVAASGKAEFAKRVEVRNEMLSIAVQATVRQGAQFADAKGDVG